MMGSGRHSFRPDRGLHGRPAGLALALCSLFALVFHSAFHFHEHDEIAKIPHCTVCAAASHGVPAPAADKVVLPSGETDRSFAGARLFDAIPAELPELPPGQRGPPLFLPV